MLCRTLAVHVLGFLLQILPKTSSVHGAVISPSADITAPGSISDVNPVHCNDLEGWVGNGINRADCATAIRNFDSTSVQPHGSQEYEFRNLEVHQVTHLPSVVTPIKFHYGE